MACEHTHRSFWLLSLYLPQANLPVKASAGEQAAIGTPGQRLQERATVGVPEPNGSIISAAGERASIGGERHALDAVGRPTRPEQRALLYVP